MIQTHPRMQVVVKAQETSAFFEPLQAAELDLITLTNEQNNTSIDTR